MLDRLLLPRVYGIDVGLHVHAALAGRLDQRDDLVHPAPELLVGDLEVDDVHRHAGPLADRDRLLDRVEDAGPLVADVRRVDAAVLRRRPCTARRGRRSWPASRAAWPACVDRPNAPSFIASSSSAFISSNCSGGRPVERLAHHALPDVVQADVGGDVDATPGLLDGVEVAAERGPAATSLPRDLDVRGASLPLQRPGRACPRRAPRSSRPGGSCSGRCRLRAAGSRSASACR